MILISVFQLLAQTGPTVTAFEHVTLVAMQDDRAMADQTVVVRGEHIVWVGPASDARVPRGARRVDGRGRVLFPGLIDAHAHVTSADMPAFLANGVTSVREMNGSPAHLALRAELRDGSRPGPTLFVASTLMAGESLRWRHLLVGSDTAAARAVHEAAAAGYDFVKVYDGLSKEAFQAIVAAARAAGLPTIGHVPRAVGLEAVLASGQRSVEHVQILDAVSGAPDSTQVALVAAQFRTAGVWMVPTLAVFEVLALSATEPVQRLFEAPEMAWADPDVWGWWTGFRRASPAPEAPPRAVARLRAYRLLVRELARRGVPLAAGTDTPNPLMVPGFSLLREIRALEGAGLSRYQALAAATREAAGLLMEQPDFGTIAPGSRADLQLLAANPLQELEALGDPVGVMARGQWYPRDRLRAMLAAARRR